MLNPYPYSYLCPWLCPLGQATVVSRLPLVGWCRCCFWRATILRYRLKCKLLLTLCVSCALGISCFRAFVPHALIPPRSNTNSSAGTVSSTSVPNCAHCSPHPRFSLCHSSLFSSFLGHFFVVSQRVCFAHIICNAADTRRVPSDSRVIHPTS